MKALSKVMCLIAMVALAATLAACGSNASSASASASESASSASASASESASAESTSESGSASASGSAAAPESASAAASESTPASDGASDSAAASESASSESPLTEAEDEAQMQAFLGDGIVSTFIGEKLSDDKITDADAALACIKNAYDRIGADETTELELDSIRPNEDGMTVMTFVQRAGEVLVYGSTVKLIVDKDNNPIALVSSIMPNVQIRPIDEWAIDDTKAEQIVMNDLKAQGSKDVLVEGATESTLLPFPGVQAHYVYAWVVYTFQTDNNDEQAYAAHYVTADGNYLYSMPVTDPGDPDATSGESAKLSFDFDAYEPDEMHVTLEHSDGTSEEVTVPVLKDSASGKYYLADAKRKILCADYAAYKYGEEIQPIEIEDSVNMVDANEYYSFIRVWDYYESVGWTSPDDEGTPTLLLMNYVDMNGNPIINALYETKDNGFQVFAFAREVNFGECLDIMAHEFTHCVTATTMTTNLYQNDQGAINEAMSDIMGNLVEMRLEGDEGAWIIGEKLESPNRNMADPHEYAQPEFTFDVFYAPHPATITGINDRGGVHTNSSLLNSVSYKLDKAGMDTIDQAYFWLNTALVISPQSDYPMLADILPWVMQQLGYDQFIEPLKEAIEEAKFTITEDPNTIPEGCGSVTFDLASIPEAVENGMVCIGYYKAPEADPKKCVDTWPTAGTTVAKANLPAGDYYVIASFGDQYSNVRMNMILSNDGWKSLGDSQDINVVTENGKTVTVEAGQTLEIPNDGFVPAATELLEQIEKILAENAAA